MLGEVAADDGGVASCFKRESYVGYANVEDEQRHDDCTASPTPTKRFVSSVSSTCNFSLCDLPCALRRSGGTAGALLLSAFRATMFLFSD